MSERITITLIEYGTSTVTVDREEYEAAKAADRLDHLLDADASDVETETTVVEPDGTRFALYGGDVYAKEIDHV